MALSKVNPNFVSQTPYGRRNLIINGAMNIWQRGTTKTFTANDSANYHTADRWGQFVDIDQGSGSLSVTISQSSDVPLTEGFTYSLKGATTPSSFVPAGEDNLALFTQKIETFNCNPLKWGRTGAEPATLSYWIKSDTAGTGTIQIRLTDSSSVSGAGDGNYYTSFTINQANTWEYKTHLIPANSTDGWRRSVSDIGMHIHWYFGSNQSAAGTQDAWYRNNNHGAPHSSQTLDFMTNAGEAYLTGVQLEVGSEATPFEHLSYGEELTLCQRYYWQTADVQFFNYGGAGQLHCTAFNPVEMRETPTLTLYPSQNDLANKTNSGNCTKDGIGNISVDPLQFNKFHTACYVGSGQGTNHRVTRTCDAEL